MEAKMGGVGVFRLRIELAKLPKSTMMVMGNRFFRWLKSPANSTIMAPTKRIIKVFNVISYLFVGGYATRIMFMMACGNTPQIKMSATMMYNAVVSYQVSWLFIVWVWVLSALPNIAKPYIRSIYTAQKITVSPATAPAQAL